jgi:SAM-dependent methyltransferase
LTKRNPKIVLNVGGGPSREVPRVYRGWTQRLLDIDPAVKPDVLCDARQMSRLRPNQYDAIYCSHTLEHFHRHEVPSVLQGFHRVLQPTGFAQIIVPDMNQVFKAIVEGGKDINDVWYTSPGGPITFHDVIYGWGRAVANGNAYYCHKTGFTEDSLTSALLRAGYTSVRTAADTRGNLHSFAFKAKPKRALLEELGCL